jgi:hypothetical protein
METRGVSRRIRIALAILLAGVGLFLAALAGAAGRLAGDLRHDDAAFAADVSTPGLWAERRSRADRAALRLTSIEDDLALRRAESAFVRSRSQVTRFDQEMQRLTVRGDAEASLDAIARTASDPAQRSRAALLLGVLLWEDAHGSGGSGPALVQRSIQAFESAARQAPVGDDAKYDLELVLDLTQPSGERRRDAPEDSGGQGGIGAGASTAGSGY